MTCINSRDTITTEDGRVVGSVPYPTDGQTVRSHCRDANGTWVAWINDIPGDTIDDPSRVIPRGDGDMKDWPARIASAFSIGVAYFPDDGSGPFTYELGVNPVYEWSDLPIVRQDASGCDYWFVLGSLFAEYGRADLLGWHMAVHDVQIRTDNAGHVWVIALAEEAVPYPYCSPYQRQDKCGNLHPSMLELRDEFGDAPFSLDGAHWWRYGVGGGVGGATQLFPEGYDDAGWDLSFTWWPARLTVWAGDIGGFENIGNVNAEFGNSERYGLYSGIEAAASPAEPGVLHLMWAEGGTFGSVSDTIDPPKIGQRIHYSRWDAGGQILDTDLLRTWEYDPFGPRLSAGATAFISPGNWVWTAEMILRNDHGSPIAIVWPWLTDTDVLLNGVLLNSGPTQPDSAAQFWDLADGSITVLQTLDPGLVPTGSETGETDPIQPAGEVIGNFTPSYAYTSSDPVRSQFASRLYTDPTLEDQDVYLICVGYSLSLGGSTLVAAFYRIPVDGSGPFEYMDGIRATNYSIAVGIDFAANLKADFVSDPDNVWVPAGVAGGGAVLHLYRRCIPAWELDTAFLGGDGTFPRGNSLDGAWVASGAGVDDRTSPPSIVTDDAGDWLASGGIVPPDQGGLGINGPMSIAALRAKICRCCVPCGPLELRTWHKLS